MLELHGRQEDIAHAYGTLATVVNQTRTYIKQLTIQQRHLHDQVIKLDTAIITLGQAVNTNSKKLHQVALLTDLDRCFNILDLAAQHYLDQITLFNRQRSGLEGLTSQGHSSHRLSFVTYSKKQQHSTR